MSNDSTINFNCTNHPSRVLNYSVFRRGESEGEDKSQIIGYYFKTNTVTVTRENGYIYAAGVSANYGNGSYVTMSLSEWK